VSIVCVVLILATPCAKRFIAQTRDAKELARRVGAFVDVALLVVIVDGDHVMHPRGDIHLLSQSQREECAEICLFEGLRD
jgi:hypothetical protein